MLGAGSSTWSPGSGAGAGWARGAGKGGLDANFLHPLETELRKHQAWGLRVPCRLDKPQRWIWQPGQWKGNLPWVLDRSEGQGDRLPISRTSLTQPLAPSRLFPLSGCWLYLQLRRKQRGRRRAERESPISR